MVQLNSTNSGLHPPDPGIHGKPGEPGEPPSMPAVRSLQRSAEILSLFSEVCPTLSLREMIERTGLAKTTVLRHVKTLHSVGLLWFDGSGRYALGPRLARWAGLAAQTWQPPPEVARRLADLVERHGETMHIYVRSGLERVCVTCQEAPRPLRHVVGLGERRPLWGGAASKALLCEADDELLVEVANSSPDGLTRMGTLREWRENVRRNGYAESDGELEIGLSSVAVPIRSAGGEVLASLSFGGPSARFGSSQVRNLAQVLMSAVAELGPAWAPAPLHPNGPTIPDGVSRSVVGRHQKGDADGSRGGS